MDQNKSHPLPPSTVQLIRRCNAKDNALIERELAEAPRLSASTVPSSHRPKQAARGDGEAIAARLSLAGFYDRGISDGLPSDDHITGRTLTAHTLRRHELEKIDWHDLALEFPKQTGSMLTRQTFLSVPIVRTGRPRTAGTISTTTFHFEFTVVTKARPGDAGRRGLKNAATSASDHASYLEREDAVERHSAEGLPGPEKPSNGDQAGRLDQITEAELGADYIERGATATSEHDQQLAIISNISVDPAERIAFWGSVERHERTPGEDRMRIDFSRNLKLWKKVVADPDCPEIFARNAAPLFAVKPVPGGSTIVTGSNEKMRALMLEHGLMPRRASKAQAGEQSLQSLARPGTHDEQVAAQGFAFSDARGGRVQMRMIGEFPDEIDHDGRVRILKGFAAEFEKRRLPYTAVIHAPNATNHVKNFHFHLVSHDQPVRRFTGHAKDHIPPLSQGAGKEEREKHQVMCAAINDSHVQAQIGKWDFEVEFTRRDSSRRLKTSKPFAQKKNREVNGRAFIGHMRKRLAELTNDELVLCHAKRRVDHRSFAAIGIPKDPGEHLGNDRSQREKHGIPTAKGVSNERKDWAYQLRRLADLREGDLSLLTEFREASIEPPAPLVGANHKIAYQRVLEDIAARERQRIENAYQLRFLRQVTSRAKSRAEAVRKTCGAALKTCEAGLAKLMDKDPQAKDGQAARERKRMTLMKRRADLERRKGEALAHLKIVEATFEPERALIKELAKGDQTAPDLDAALAQEVRKIMRAQQEDRLAEIAASKATKIDPKGQRPDVEATDPVVTATAYLETRHTVQPDTADQAKKSNPRAHTQPVARSNEDDHPQPSVRLPQPETPAAEAAPAGGPSPSSPHAPITDIGKDKGNTQARLAASIEQGAAATEQEQARPGPSSGAQSNRTSDAARPTWARVREQAKAARAARESENVATSEETSQAAHSPARGQKPSIFDQLAGPPRQPREPDDIVDPRAAASSSAPAEGPGPIETANKGSESNKPTSPVAAQSTPLPTLHGPRPARSASPPDEPSAEEAPRVSPAPFDMEAERARIFNSGRRPEHHVLPLQLGLHPLLDLWIEARVAKDPVMRAKAARSIVKDREAVAGVKKLAPALIEEVRSDREAARKQDAEARRKKDTSERAPQTGRGGPSAEQQRRWEEQQRGRGIGDFWP